MAGRMILVADEDADTRIILRTVLERHGFSIVDAGSADSAITLAAEIAFDLVILNHPMSCETGESLVQRLRTDRTTQNIPIVNLTSRVVPQFMEDAAREGVTITVPKPIDVERITTLVLELTTQKFVSAS